MKPSATLVFDLGKTAKKVLLFDDRFEAVDEKVEHFKETFDDEGFPAEDLSVVSRWVEEMLATYLHHSGFNVTHINFSAYGASLVHLDETGTPFKSFYNYLKSFPEDCRHSFLTTYNRDQQLLTDTASPWLGMLNSGLQLYWMKQKKTSLFQQIRTSLHFPQYFPFLLSGEKLSDITSIGCHTMLWDFQRSDYHAWVKQEGLTNLFGPVTTPDQQITTTLHGKKVTLGTGVHDSSAALMPYLVTHHEPFILLSTGTWNIAFNPFNQEPLMAEELKQDSLCYLTFQGKPVKASRIFLGHEYELQVKAISTAFATDASAFSKFTFSEALYKNVSSEKIIYPIGMEGTGPLPENTLQKTSWHLFTDVEEAYYQMIRQLVRWQLLSLDLVDPHHRVKQLIIVGGFTKNEIFLQILKREAKHLSVYLSDHPRAAALGAAWLVKGESAYRDQQHLLNIYSLS